MAVVGAPEELHPVEQDAVDLLVVEGVLLRAAREEVAPDEAIGAVDAQNDVLGVAAGLRRRPRALIVGARVEDHVLGLRAGALDLQVAPHAGAELLRRDPLAVRERRLWRVAHHRAPLHVDQVLVVGAGDLVLVARGEVAAGVLLEQAGVAASGRSPGRCASQVRCSGRAGSGRGRCCPRRGSPAGPSRSRTASPALVDAEQPVRLLLGELDLRLARTEAIALLAGLAHRRAQVGQRLLPVLCPCRRPARRPVPAPLGADFSERASGTSPPAGGVTVLSGAGSGQ